MIDLHQPFYAALAGVTTLFVIIIYLHYRLNYRGKPPYSATGNQNPPYEPFIPGQDKPDPNEGQHRAEEQAHWDWQRYTEKSRDRVSGKPFVLSVIAIIVSVLSFYETLRQANIAQEANRMNVDSRRAWMSGPELVDGKFVFKNVGQTPTDGLYIDMEPLKSGESGSDAILKICARIKADYEIKKPPFSAIPAANWLVGFSDIPSAKLFPANFPQGGLTSDTRIVGCTIYRTPSDQRLHQTGFEAFVLSQAGGVLSQTGGPSLRYSYTEHAD